MHYLLEGFKLISKPGIKRFVVIPFIINMILFTALFFLARYYFSELNSWIENHLPHWLLWLGNILWLIFFISFALVMVYTFSILANLIAAPFNGLLAEKIEWYLTGNELDNKTWLQFLKDTPAMIGRQLLLIGYYLPRACLLIILFFIPVVQLVAGVLWFLFNAWYMTLQYVDYPTDNHHIPLNAVREWMLQKKWLSLSFGTSILVMSMIPILNFFVVPAAVAGATKFYLDNKA
jgi:CysZ protein